MFGEFSIVSTNLSSQNICSVQSLFDLFIASVIQSLYSTAISHGLNRISFSFNSFEISFIIHKASHHDLTL